VGDKAIDSLHKLVSSSVFIFLLWILNWPTAIEKLEYYRDARDLHAWLFLQNRVENLGLDYIFLEQAPTEDVIEDCWENSEFPGFTCEPLEVKTTWPVASTYTLRLQSKYFLPEDDRSMNESGSLIRIYKVEVAAEELPFSDYEVIIIGTGEAWVVPANKTELYEKLERDSDSFRLLSIDVKEYARPISWRRIAPDMAKYGFRLHPLSLGIREPALDQLATDADPRDLTISIFGMNISIGLFISAIGLLLGANAFLMIGPLLALRNAGIGNVSHAWIMVTPTRSGSVERILEFFLSLISMVWFLIPFAILLLQLNTDVESQSVEIIAKKVGMIGLLFSGIVYAIVGFQLRVYRRLEKT
jgi:hypothetical protein